MPFSFDHASYLAPPTKSKPPGPVALHVAVGRLLVVRVELEQRRVVGLLLRLLRGGGGGLELGLEVVLLGCGGHAVLLAGIRLLRFRATLARTQRRAQRAPTTPAVHHGRDPETRKDFRGRHRVAAHGPAAEPDDDLRRAAVPRAPVARAPAAGDRRALPRVPPVQAAPHRDGRGSRSGRPTRTSTSSATSSTRRCRAARAARNCRSSCRGSRRRRSIPRARCGSSTSSTTTTAAARSSCASTTATRTASRWSASCCR